LIHSLAGIELSFLLTCIVTALVYFKLGYLEEKLDTTIDFLGRYLDRAHKLINDFVFDKLITVVETGSYAARIVSRTIVKLALQTVLACFVFVFFNVIFRVGIAIPYLFNKYVYAVPDDILTTIIVTLILLYSARKWYIFWCGIFQEWFFLLYSAIADYI